jgi:Transglutaminase-like superfamily
VIAVALTLADPSRSGYGGAISQLVSPQALRAQTTLPKAVEAIRPQVATIMKSNLSVWQKATAANELFRAALPIGSGDCGEYTLWFTTLVRPYGLQVRMVSGSINTLDPYDTHASVEVWLPRRRHWVLLSPTFGGEYTVDGRPIGAYDIQWLIRTGRIDEVHWESSHTKNSTMLSNYYVNPALLFRYVGVSVQHGEELVTVANPDSRALGRVTTTRLSGSTPPDAPITMTASQAPALQPSIGYPPWYASHRVTGKYRGAVVLVSTKRFTYRGYDSAESRGEWVSPIVLDRGGIPDHVTAFAVREFPRSRES